MLKEIPHEEVERLRELGVEPIELQPGDFFQIKIIITPLILVLKID